MADAQEHGDCPKARHQLLDVLGTLAMLGRVGQRHQVEHFDAVLTDLVAQATLDAAWHLLLHLDGQRKQLNAGAIDGQIGVDGHGSKGLKD